MEQAEWLDIDPDQYTLMHLPAGCFYPVIKPKGKFFSDTKKAVCILDIRSELFVRVMKNQWTGKKPGWIICKIRNSIWDIQPDGAFLYLEIDSLKAAYVIG